MVNGWWPNSSYSRSTSSCETRRRWGGSRCKYERGGGVRWGGGERSREVLAIDRWPEQEHALRIGGGARSPRVRGAASGAAASGAATTGAAASGAAARRCFRRCCLRRCCFWRRCRCCFLPPRAVDETLVWRTMRHRGRAPSRCRISAPGRAPASPVALRRPSAERAGAPRRSQARRGKRRRTRRRRRCTRQGNARGCRRGRRQADFAPFSAFACGSRPEVAAARRCCRAGRRAAQTRRCPRRGPCREASRRSRSAAPAQRRGGGGGGRRRCGVR